MQNFKQKGGEVEASKKKNQPILKKVMAKGKKNTNQEKTNGKHNIRRQK